MAKYSDEFKADGCEGVSGWTTWVYKLLAKKHGIKSNTQLERLGKSIQEIW